ncbi:MAG: hypothetical protein HY812_02815 [Planctomycetes bacterium]|nr:hypothetical protein [Planctomycetota bacterium]
MKDATMDRKAFLKCVGATCAGSCLCALGLSGASGQEEAPSPQEEAPPSKPEGAPRAVKRIEFAESWVKRLMRVLDENLDAETAKKVMMANGAACFREYIRATGQTIRPVSRDELAAFIQANVKDDSIRIEGDVIHFQFKSSAETGKPAPEGACLCSLVETKPAGLSGTYCLCSVGYVKEWHEQLLGRPVEVELVDSVLRGGARCRFQITLS